MATSTAKADKKHKSIYVFAGKELDVVNNRCDKLIDTLIETSQRVTGLLNVEADKALISDVLDELRTLPFLAEKRVVVIKDAGKFISENRNFLENYFDNPSATGVLVMTVTSWPSNTKLAKKLSNVGVLIDVTSPKRWQLPQKICEYAQGEYGKTLNKAAAELLVELVGEGLGKLYSEIDKLALFADEKKTITCEHIEALIGHNRMFNVFAVIDACLERRPALAVERLRRMFASDKSTEFTVVGGFAFHIRRMFNAKVLLDRGDNVAQIASQLKIYGNKEGFFSQLRKTTLKQIGDSLKKLAEIDYALKTGGTKASAAMEQFVLEMAV